MCEGHNLPERMRSIRKYIQALHCPTRWDIIDCIGTGQKSSKEIYEELKLGEAGMTFAGLYYHLSALKGAGIIEVASLSRDERSDTGKGVEIEDYKNRN